MIKLKHQLVVAMLGVLPMATAAYAQPAPTTDDSEPVSCPPGNGEPNAACPQPAQQAPQPPAAPSQTVVVQPTPPPPQPESYEGPVVRQYAHTPWFGMMFGGGVDDFAGSAFRGATRTGGGWNVRLMFGQHSFLGAEVAYIGSAQEIQGLGVRTNNPVLVGNGVEGDLRLNGTRYSFLQPFIFGGVAWRHYTLSQGQSAFADLSNTSNVLEVPAGLGLAVYVGHVIIDARGEYRFAFGGDSNENGNPSLDRWGASGNLGFEF